MRKHILLLTSLALFTLLLIQMRTPEARSLSHQSRTTTVKAPQSRWPRRVLITNDNGIRDLKIVELARAFARVAETYVAAPREDRSGTTHFLSVTRTKRLEVERATLGQGIIAYAVNGYPADCVVFGIMGLMRDNPPDLVISGINGGPNLSVDWIGSGTVGAARIATILGVPALAISGLNDDYPESVTAATEWVVALARSNIVRQMKPGQYLTVSIPRVKPSDITGIEIARRQSNVIKVSTKKSSEGAAGSGREIWSFGEPSIEGPHSADSDIAVYQSNRIAVVPMRADEHDYQWLSDLKSRMGELPAWNKQKR